MENYNEQEQEQNQYNQSPPSNETHSHCSGGNCHDGKMFKIGSIIVILGILLLGALYFMSDTDNKTSTTEQVISDELDDVFGNVGSTLDEAIADVKDTVTDQLVKQGTSDVIADIEADLEASDLGEINLDDLGF